MSISIATDVKSTVITTKVTGAVVYKISHIDEEVIKFIFDRAKTGDIVYMQGIIFLIKNSRMYYNGHVDEFEYLSIIINQHGLLHTHWSDMKCIELMSCAFMGGGYIMDSSEFDGISIYKVIIRIENISKYYVCDYVPDKVLTSTPFKNSVISLPCKMYEVIINGKTVKILCNINTRPFHCEPLCKIINDEYLVI